MSTQPNNPAAAAAAAKVNRKAGTNETAKVSAASVNQLPFNPSAKLRRAINSNNSAANKYGRKNIEVICAASVLIHETSLEVNAANKGVKRGAPTYVNKEAAILALFGVNKVDLSRIYTKVAKAIFDEYSGDAVKLYVAYESQLNGARPSVSGLLEFINGGKSDSKPSAPKISVNLETLKVSLPKDVTPQQIAAALKAIKSAMSEAAAAE